MNRTLLIGLIIVATGLLWPWLGELPLGHLRGNIVIRRENFLAPVNIEGTDIAESAAEQGLIANWNFSI